MAPRTGSRHSFTLGLPDELERRFLSEREPYRFKEHTDSRVHVVAQGDTLEGLAERGTFYFSADAAVASSEIEKHVAGDRTQPGSMKRLFLKPYSELAH